MIIKWWIRAVNCVIEIVGDSREEFCCTCLQVSTFSSGI